MVQQAYMPPSNLIRFTIRLAYTEWSCPSPTDFEDKEGGNATQVEEGSYRAGAPAVHLSPRKE